MDLINLLLSQENSQKICFLCFLKNEDDINVDDSMEIYDEMSNHSTSMRTITNYLFPSYDIITRQSCETCAQLIIKMYTTINRGLTKIKMIQQLTEKIYNELESKSVLLRNKMTINLQEEKTAKENLENPEVIHKNIKRTKKTVLICDVCGKSFKRPNSLKTHIKFHTETQCPPSHKLKHKKPYKRNINNIYNCNDCDYKTGNKQDLKSHMNKNHLNLRPYSCNMCHKAFYSNKNLKEHCLTHERNKNMVCDICGERLSYRKTLEFHMKSHVNDRPYNCVECGHKFVSISKRNEHIKRKHGLKDYKCDLCDLKYSLKKELNRHVKVIHNLII